MFKLLDTDDSECLGVFVPDPILGKAGRLGRPTRLPALPSFSPLPACYPSPTSRHPTTFRGFCYVLKLLNLMLSDDTRR